MTAAAETISRPLQAAIDGLLATDFSAIADAQLLGMVEDLERQRRRLDAVDQRLIASMIERGIAASHGRTGTADLLVALLRVSPSEAKSRVARASDLGPRRDADGQPLEPVLPQVAAASEAGEISSAHVAVITSCLDAIPTEIAHEVGDVAEQQLVEAAKREHPRALARTASLLLTRLDPDGLSLRDEEQQRRRGFTLTRNGDGSAVPHGRWTPELAALWQPILDALSAPVPAEDGIRDRRTPAQRRHDAMAEAATRLLSSGQLPNTGGVPVTVLAMTTFDELAAGVGVATTGHGDPISVASLLAIAAEAEVIPAVLADTGGVVAYGRARRLASRSQRLALAARDRGCSFPGCDRPPSWTEVHHVVPWNDGGPTDLDNMCLLCRYHHREFERHGWQVRMIDAVPHWIPPPRVDPQQRPRRNRVNHRAEPLALRPRSAPR